MKCTSALLSPMRCYLQSISFKLYFYF